MDLQRRIDDRLLRRVKPTGLDEPRGGVAGEPGGSGLPSATNYLYLPWYNVAWPYRALITIPRGTVATDLTNFPVYISGTGMPSLLWSAAQADGDDVLITAEDGVTKLAHDLPHFAPGSTTMELHFLAPALYAREDNRFWLYWGNAAASDQRNAAGVWGSGYISVHHLHESASGTGTADVYDDSSGNALDGDDYITPGSKVGKLFATGGETFSGVDGQSYIRCSVADYAAEMNGKQAISWSGWFKRADTGRLQFLFDSRTTGGSYKYAVSFDVANTVSAHVKPVGTGTSRRVTTSSTFTDTNWHLLHVVVNVAGDTVAIYVDGTAQAVTGTMTFTETAFDGANSGTYAAIGGFYSGGSGYSFAGTLDEARMIIGALSADWIAAEYVNQSDPASFYQVGPATGRIVPALLTDTTGYGLDEGWML